MTSANRFDQIVVTALWLAGILGLIVAPAALGAVGAGPFLFNLDGMFPSAEQFKWAGRFLVAAGAVQVLSAIAIWACAIALWVKRSAVRSTGIGWSAIALVLLFISAGLYFVFGYPSVH